MKTLQEESLARFGLGCVGLKDQLERDIYFSDTDQQFIENCVTMIILRYACWKNRKDPASLRAYHR